MQSRRQSIIEVTTNTFVGMVGSWLIVWTVMGAIQNRELSATVNVVLCTIWSLARGYWVRRRFAAMERPNPSPQTPSTPGPSPS